MAFDRIYTTAQREAAAYAYNVRALRPAQRVSELAAAGSLETADGRRLEPFRMPTQTVRDCARRDRARKASSARAAAQLEPADAIDALRRRLIGIVDAELETLERAQRARRPVDAERARQIARALRELAAIPGAGAGAPRAPGPRADGTGAGKTRGGLAGRILAAHASSGPALEPAPAVNGPAAPELEPDH